MGIAEIENYVVRALDNTHCVPAQDENMRTKVTMITLGVSVANARESIEAVLKRS
jgi:hypothetical protein